MSTTRPAEEIVVRHLHSLEEFQRCIELEKQVWGGADVDLVPLPIFVVVAHTGGQVFGAFAGGQMVGFTLGMAAFRQPNAGGSQLFIHSHMTAVMESHRDRGVGRQLKLFQRQDALRRGIQLVEWTFDPLEMRNAHFNLMRLGAIVRRFLPNCYGVTSSPLHAGMPTDRLVAEWWLCSPRVIRVLDQQEQHKGAGVNAERILVPSAIHEWRKSKPAQALEAQNRIGEDFQRLLGKGYVATGIERTAAGASYVLEPYESVRKDLHAST